MMTSALVIALVIAALVLVSAGGRVLGGRLRSPAPLPPQDMRRQFVDRTVTCGGMGRTYLLYVPTALSRSGSEAASRASSRLRRVPLVLAFHGGGGGPRSLLSTELHHLAETERFLLACPAGTGRPGQRGLAWNTSPSVGGDARLSADRGADRGAGGTGGSRGSVGGSVGGSGERADGHAIDDVAFVRAVIDDLCRTYPVDPGRIYAIGVSLGGMFAYHLACRMSETFAAIAVVAGAMTTSGCEPASPVAVLHVHGTDDQNVPLKGGRGRLTARGNDWPPVDDGLAFWRDYNRCVDQPTVTYREGEVYCWRYSAPDKADVEVCLVDDGGHAWPGMRQTWWQRLVNYVLGIRVDPSFPTSRWAWQFFRDHPRR